MKTRAIVAVLGSFLTLVLLAGCGPGKYVPKPNEEIYGTWVNEKARPQKIVIDQAGAKEYGLLSDTTPLYVTDAGETQAKWKDADGNIWYKSLFTMTAGISKGQKFTRLDKLSKSATVWESVWRVYNLGEGEKPIYPKNIDPSEKNYGVYYRAKE